MADCLLCARLEQIDAGRYPYAVAQLSTGYVNLMECQYYEGTCLLYTSPSPRDS